MLYYVLLPVAVALVAVIDPVLSQVPPCQLPYPELAGVVDTLDKCMCFYALAGSKFGSGAEYDTFFNDDSVQQLAQVGSYHGADGIAEYYSFVRGGAFISDFIQVGQTLFLDMTGTTNEKCVATLAERRRTPFNPIYTKDNKELSADMIIGSTLYYTITGNSTAPVTVQKLNSHLPEVFIPTVFPLLVDTPATAEYVCDTIVNTCGYDGSSKTKAPKKNKTKAPKKNKKNKAAKKGKNSKQSNAMKECLVTYNSLADIDEIGGYFYADGNTKGCRLFHSYFASSNLKHCPHISFEADEDSIGRVKCIKSKGVRTTDLFTEQQLELFAYANNALGLGPTGFQVNFEASPTQP